MAKLVDAPDLGSGVLRRVGSSPITRTAKRILTTDNQQVSILFFLFLSTRCGGSLQSWGAFFLYQDIVVLVYK